jgi:hypothetical protein
MRTGFQEPSDEDLAMLHLKLLGGPPRNWVRDDRAKGNHPCYRYHRCPDWVHCHLVPPPGCWEQWERSGRSCNGPKRVYIGIHLNLALYLKPTTIQFLQKPETRIGVVGRRFSVFVERMVLSCTVACCWGINIHESIRRLSIADPNRDPSTREFGCENLTAGR